MEGTMQRDPQTYAIIGAGMEVHGELGPGFLEAVYQDALAIEFDARGIPYVREPEMVIRYKDRLLRKRYTPDYLCYGRVVVELKAQKGLTPNDEAIALNYLRASNGGLSLLLNFGTHRLEYRRIILSSGSPFRPSIETSQDLDGAADEEAQP
jgi:GxxExxY protein